MARVERIGVGLRRDTGRAPEIVELQQLITTATTPALTDTLTTGSNEVSLEGHATFQPIISTLAFGAATQLDIRFQCLAVLGEDANGDRDESADVWVDVGALSASATAGIDELVPHIIRLTAANLGASLTRGMTLPTLHVQGKAALRILFQFDAVDGSTQLKIDGRGGL